VIFKKYFLSTPGEIFDMKTEKNLDNSSLFTFREVISPFLGKCYTACYRLSFTENSDLIFGLKTDWNYKFYIHGLNEETWLGGTGNFPLESVAIILGKTFNFQTGVIIILFSFQERLKAQTCGSFSAFYTSGLFL